MGNTIGRSLEPGGKSRAEAELLGVVLLIALVIVGAASVFIVGGTALGQLEGSSQDEAASQSLVNAKAEMSALQTGDVSEISLSESVRANTRVESQSGNFTIRTADGEEYNTTFGSIVYERDGNHIAYQGGGVWELHDNTSTVVSNPQFDNRGGGNETVSLHFAATSLQGAERSGSDLTIRSKGTNESLQDLPQTLPEGPTTIEIESEYYEAWGKLLEERTEMDVEYDHGAETVTGTLTVSDEVTIENALTVDGELDASGGISVSSYDSNGATVPAWEGVGDGSYQETGNGDLVVTDRIRQGGSADISGDIYVADDFSISGGANVDGNITATGDVDIGSATVTERIVSDGDVSVTSGGASFEDGSEVNVANGFTNTGGGNSFDGVIRAGNRLEIGGGGAGVGETGVVHAQDIVDISNEHPAAETYEGDDADAPSLDELDVITERTDSMPDPRDEVATAVTQYEDTNDNDDLGAIGGGNADDTIRAGNYYIDGNLEYSGNSELTFDTNDGDIDLVVDGDIDAQNVDSNIEGDGIVNIYVNGTFETGGSASWTNDDGAGDRLWIYTADSGGETYIQASGGDFYGVIFSASEVRLGGGTNVYGAIITEGSDISGGQSIYYDEAIQDTDLGGIENEGVFDTAYIDISATELTVDDQ
ncbi:DUF7289 family protein [Natrinema amylolyticum]|uniref:DUF7289 family protein n=1 Tax=Natrinema amylolyticum TaxID=2878679 RepID=UPI001CFA164D|nr:hypothetical protein [Natrinema amylolyticum]